MAALPGGAPYRPTYTRKTVLIILGCTLIAVTILLSVYRILVHHGEDVARQIDQNPSPLWDPSRHIE